MNIKVNLGNYKNEQKVYRQGRRTGLTRKDSRKVLSISKLFISLELPKVRDGRAHIEVGRTKSVSGLNVSSSKLQANELNFSSSGSHADDVAGSLMKAQTSHGDDVAGSLMETQTYRGHEASRLSNRMTD